MIKIYCDMCNAEKEHDDIFILTDIKVRLPTLDVSFISRAFAGMNNQTVCNSCMNTLQEKVNNGIGVDLQLTGRKGKEYNLTLAPAKKDVLVDEEKARKAARIRLELELPWCEVIKQRGYDDES